MRDVLVERIGNDESRVCVHVGFRVADMFTERSENAGKLSVGIGIIEHVSE
jgi:hypothetical protein